MKIVNNERENLHIFWKTWGNSMKFSENCGFMMTLPATKMSDLWRYYQLQNVGLMMILPATKCRTYDDITSHKMSDLWWYYQSQNVGLMMILPATQNVGLMTILPATKKQRFTLFLEDTPLEKPKGVQMDPQSFKS